MIPSHQLAKWLTRVIDWLLSLVGLEKSETAEQVIYFVIVLAIALGLGWALRRIILAISRRWVRLRNDDWSRELLHEHTLSKCCQVIPPLVLLGFLPFAFDRNATWHVWATRLVVVWMIVAFCYGLCAVAKFVWMRYDAKANQRHLPTRGIYDLVIGVVWIVCAILSVSVLIDKSPAMLLTGLGACAAALMLVFKDSILGFVAGIQLSNNDMVRVGDWITVPGTPADGVVTDVNISVVKVQNFDNTMVYLPPYSLVSSSFKNWRGMSASGIRLISRNLLVDAASIKADEKNPQTTNLTEFRAWVLEYLNGHPKLNHTPQPNGNALTMVRIMPQEAAGVPMQIYCFTATTVWPEYEAIQSEIIEQIIAAAPRFGVVIYNYPQTL